MYKAVLFDFFGIFCSDISLAWFKKSVPGYKKHLSAFQEICGRSDRGELTQHEFSEELSSLTQIPVEDVIEGIENEVIINEPLIAFVKSLKGKYKLGVVSNATNEWTDVIIAEYGMNELFDEIVLSANVGKTKPGKEIFDYTLNKLQITADEAIFIDDRESNVIAAASYGIKSLLFTDNKALTNHFRELGVISTIK